MTKTFRKTDKQVIATRLMAQQTFTLLRGGSRSGKTFITLRNIVQRACRVQSRHLIARHRFNHVKQSIIMDTWPKMLRMCYPNLQVSLNKSDWFATLPNGSEIWFGGLDDKDRVEKILGNEYSTIFLNEISQMSWETVVLVMTRLAENSGLTLRMWMDMNPTSVKFWAKTLFMDKIDPSTGVLSKYPEKYGTMLINPYDNQDNLSQTYFDILDGLPERARKRFLLGEFQTDIEGALWDFEMIEKAKVLKVGEPVHTVIAVDPAVTNNPNSDATGIIACSIDADGNGIIHDDFSIKASPRDWAVRVVNAYEQYEANAVVVEVNQGGDLVEEVLHSVNANMKIIKVRASKGKFARAEPVASLYEQGKVAHDKAMLDLEAELTEYVPMNSTESPDRLDALVWGLSYLMIKKTKEPNIRML